MTLLRVALLLAGATAVLLGVNAVTVDRVTRPAAGGPGRIVQVPGGDLHVREHGDRGPAIVLLHGFTLSMRSWQRVVPRLARDHRVLSIDLLGHGGSEKPRSGYSPDEQAKGVAAVLDRLRVRCALVVGHSLGGIVGGALVQRRPRIARGLVAVATAADWDAVDFPLAARASTWPVLGELIHRTVPDRVVARNLAPAFSSQAPVPAEFVSDYRRLTYSAYRGSWRETRRFLQRERLDERLRETGVPTLALVGTADRIVDPATLRVWRRVPHATTRLLDAAAHMVPWEEPALMARLIRRFDSRLPAARRRCA